MSEFKSVRMVSTGRFVNSILLKESPLCVYVREYQIQLLD